MEHEEPTNGAEKTELSNRSIPDILPILPLRNAVIYPFLSMPVAVSRPESMKLIEETLSGQKLFGVVAQKSTEVEDPRIDEMYEVGTVVKLLKMIRTPEGEMYVLVQGVSRMKTLSFIQERPYYIATIETLQDDEEDDANDKELLATVKNLKDLFNSVAQLAYNISNEVLTMILNVDDHGLLADMIAENPSFSLQERQEVLEMLNVKARLQRVTALLTREKEILEDLNQELEAYSV